MTRVPVTRVQAVRLLEAYQKRQAAEREWTLVRELVMDAIGRPDAVVVEIRPHTDPPEVSLEDDDGEA